MSKRLVGAKGKKPKPAAPTAKPKRTSKSAAAVPAPAGGGPAAPSERCYDLPYGSPAPPLVNSELGLDSLIARAGHNAGYDIDLTLLDAPDHRLLRSGLVLAHRVLDGRGEWYLGAPDWAPLLPAEHIAPMGQADLSEDVTEKIRPFRRGAPLSPVAALHCERREFALRSRPGTTLALLRDDKVTVRRGGLIIARYREVLLTPVGNALNQRQADWLERCLTESGATALTRFPRLVRRLGAPATGPTDFPEPGPYLPDGSFSAFVSTLLARRLREVLTADLRLGSGEEEAAVELITAVETVRGELDGLRGALEETWVDDLLDELDWLAAIPVGAGETAAEFGHQVRARLRSQRYLSLLDRLVVAARGVRLGEVASEPAAAVLARLAADRLTALDRATSRLAVDGPARPWQQAWSAFERMSVVDVVVGHLHADEVAERQRRLGRCRPLLAAVQRFDAEEIMSRVDDLAPADAFALGREFERQRGVAQTARAAFLISWAKTRKRLGL